MPSLREVQTPNFGDPKDEQYKVLQDAILPHVESFNFALKDGLPHMIKNINPLEMALPNGDKLAVRLLKCQIASPSIKRGTIARTRDVFPAECRGRGVSYKGLCHLTLTWSLNGAVQGVIERTVGEVPIMVKSTVCNLNGLKPKRLVAVGEEENEFGGYFIINGNEKCVRLLIAQRRNYPIAMRRNGWKKRGDLFTDFGVAVRCVRPDQTGQNMVMHQLSDGNVKLVFQLRREMFVVPIVLILKALVNETDNFIATQLWRGKEDDTYYKNSIKAMLRQVASMGIHFQQQALEYLGEMFACRAYLPPWYTSVDVAKFLLKECICVHLNEDKEKFDFLVFMFQKLFAVQKNDCALESPDSLMNQEILTPGTLFLIVIKEKLYQWLDGVRRNIIKRLPVENPVLTKEIMEKCISLTTDITSSVENMFATGNLQPRYEGSLTQTTGLTIVADKLNYWRYMSHFRAVHRGAFFTEMRTTTVRKLLPEAWGFLCPVHTPDGTPCGLLNHMASMCQVVNCEPDTKHLFDVFCKKGMVPLDDAITPVAKFYMILLDGKVVGWIDERKANSFVSKLRMLKTSGKDNVPKHMEIAFIPRSEHNSQYPGIFIFTSSARMVRPVKNLMLNTDELIGTMEQVYLHIALANSNVNPEVTSHQEIKENGILSILANQIPYSDFNQSPRNMYECQMGKQTMGTPCHSLKLRSDNKLYNIRTPQSPLVRPEMHDYYHMDDYPLGTNAVVAVISYTGYDMEDAIVLNKSAVERGFKHGSIYKTEFVNLKLLAGDKGSQRSLFFGCGNDSEKYAKLIGADGFPHVGTRIKNGDPICCYFDSSTGITSEVRYKSFETAYIEDVKILGNDSGSEISQNVAIKLRIPRNPLIGDKFASRHGQKGICSLLLPIEDMPFTENGITPDIIFNPHGFPSRMTIGMMIEAMAGKSAAMEGVLYDAAPFQFSESDTAAEYFGERLKEAGYDYYGTERLYSGVSGTELEADIFFGVIYYQRLRHMVSDKFQVRTTGPIDPLTRQPVKGRKREGGVRFGEMERDALVAHGSAMLLHDRLYKCSDASRQRVCTKCKDVLSTSFENFGQYPDNGLGSSSKIWMCRTCGNDDNVTLIDVPYCFRYLCAELAAVNIQVQLEIENSYNELENGWEN